ncbi:MAG TPA: XdhC/CoxI family protein [Bacteroidetes bacterium]|nr:XdhC/CoxI family protein [Bacteroidota bacterium]
MMQTWDFILAKLKNDTRLVLLVVIDSFGSSPGRKGFKMVVTEDGDLQGSVGGGVMEYRLVEQARRLFGTPRKPFIRRQDHHAENTEDSSGLVCSGSQVIAFYLLDKTFLPVAEELAKAKSGQLTYNETAIRFTATENVENEQVEIFDNDHWILTEHHGYRHFLYLFGAGHVSVSVSRMFRQLGFYITVFDNRNSELVTFKSNSFAHEKHIIDYKDTARHVPEGDHVYVAIMTFAHKNDSLVLEKLLDKKIKYLGMMGSAEKVASVFSGLENRGIPRHLLDKVDSPIGLPIGSQTPDEIAVSIAAKIIQVKNG